MDMFRWMHQKDPNFKLFLNEYNVVMDSSVTTVSKIDKVCYELGLWCLTPLSTIFQLYRQFYWWRNGGPGENHRPVMVIQLPKDA